MTAIAINPDNYALLEEIIDETYTDGIDSIDGAWAYPDGSIQAFVRDEGRQLSVEIGEDVQIFQTGEDASFSASFAGGKPRNCQKGIACGGSCIAKGKTCRKKSSAGQKEKAKEIVAKANKGKDLDAKTTAAPLDPDKALAAAKKKHDNGLSGIGAGIDRLEQLKYYSEKGLKGAGSAYGILETWQIGHLASSEAAGGYMDRIYNKLSDNEKDGMAREWYDGVNGGTTPQKRFEKSFDVSKGLKAGHSPFVKDFDERVKKIRKEEGWDD